MPYKIEVIILPVSDADRALAFYTEQAGFTLDVDYHPSDDFRVVQLTPPGSNCSVQIGVGLTDAAPGSMHGLYAVVEDLQAAREELTSRGVDVSAIRHKSPIDDWRGGWDPGLDPDRRDYASVAGFTDPDGNEWVLQERGFAARQPPGTPLTAWTGPATGSGSPASRAGQLPRQ
jgi:catechol 2,3-dioxygenase-like lactoylglutathione lyase family enzyme